MRRFALLATTAALVLSLAPSATLRADDALAPVVLRAEPDRLCEASGIARVSRDATVVVDNEVDDLLFGFSATDGVLAAARARNVDLSAIPGGERPHDVEAAARVVQYLVLVGSHSRNKDCEVRPNRERMLVATLDDAGTKARTEFAVDDAELMRKLRAGDEGTCLAELFSISARPYQTTRAFCRALVAAERAASKDACTTLDIEGAATVFESGRDRLWLGLRAPLVDGKAVLVRLAKIDGFRFDALALVDLGGRGVRELATHDRELLAIAGPPADAPAPFALYRLAPQADPEAPFAPTLLRADLPTSSEGLLPTDDGAIVVVDGDAGKDGAACKDPARQYRLRLD